MDFLPIPDTAARQFIDSITVFEEYQRTRKQAALYAGGMYWKTQGAYEYLVKTQRDNSQERIGPRNAQTEAIYQEFTTRKSSLEDRLRTLRTALTDAQRLNKALKVGRTPAMVIDILQALEDDEQNWDNKYTQNRSYQHASNSTCTNGIVTFSTYTFC